jgi:hypothetical protein
MGLNHIQTNKYALNGVKKINHVIRIKKCYKVKICNRLYYVIYIRRKSSKNTPKQKNNFFRVRYDFALNMMNTTDYIRHGSPKTEMRCTVFTRRK